MSTSTRPSDSKAIQKAFENAERVFGPELEKARDDWRKYAVEKIRYLSFAGGGTSAIISACVLSDMFRHDATAYRRWRREKLMGVSGTSFGSIVACMICGGMDWNECIECVLDVFADGFNIEDRIATFHTRDCVMDESTVSASLGKICKRAFHHESATFDEVFALSGGIDLVIICCDIRTGENVRLCKDRCPGMSVADALRASCAIPLVIPALPFADMTLVDGGMINNFAFAFDDVRRTLFLSTRFEGLASVGSVSFSDAYEASKIMIDSQQFMLRKSVPAFNIVMSPRVFGFLAFPFDSRRETLDAFSRECSSALMRAFSRQWIISISMASIFLALRPLSLSPSSSS